LIRGDRACFRRPEFAEDFVTYDVMPPMVAQRVMEAAFPSTSGSWHVRSITVLNPIRLCWQTLVTARGSRRALILTDVAYVVEAQARGGWDMESFSGTDASVPAHLGLADFPASLAIVAKGDYSSNLAGSGAVDLGWMLHSTSPGRRNRFFRAVMVNGKLDLEQQDPVMYAA